MNQSSENFNNDVHGTVFTASDGGGGGGGVIVLCLVEVSEQVFVVYNHLALSKELKIYQNII